MYNAAIIFMSKDNEFDLNLIMHGDEEIEANLKNFDHEEYAKIMCRESKMFHRITENGMFMTIHDKYDWFKIPTFHDKMNEDELDEFFNHFIDSIENIYIYKDGYWNRMDYNDWMNLTRI